MNYFYGKNNVTYQKTVKTFEKTWHPIRVQDWCFTLDELELLK